MLFPEEASEASASGEYIPERATHWQIEPFIPIPISDLTAYLKRQLPDDSLVLQFEKVCRAIDGHLHQKALSMHQRLDAAYTTLDPDRDTALLVPRDDAQLDADANEVTSLMRQALEEADYKELSREELVAATDVASLWGVPLRVDFEVFRHLGVFVRGDVIGIREIRRWQRLYRKELKEVEIYRRLVVLFQVLPGVAVDGEGESTRMYLRMFKNIPKADVDMLLPGSKIRIGWLDHTRIFVPSLGGIGMSLWKLARLVLLVAVLTTSKMLVVAGLLGATIGYVFRTVSSYFQTKKNYELNLTRSLYFQKLDTNAGVIYRVLDEARQQDYREAALAYFALLTQEATDERDYHEAPTTDGKLVSVPISHRRLRRKVERILREAIEVEVCFELREALETLQELNLIVVTENSIRLTNPVATETITELGDIGQ